MPTKTELSAGSPRFERTILPNGVRVVTEHIPSVRSVSVALWINTGSRDEADDERGIAHFIEHMVFKGTKRRRTHHIAQRIESVGGYLNAFTSKENTCFYARALDAHCIRALDLILDLVLEPTFPEKEIEKEKDVVVEEMKMYLDSPEDTIFDEFELALYGDQPIGRPVIGTEETVRAFTRDQLLSYLDRYYTPDQMVVAVAGNLDHEAIVRYTEKMFAGSSRKPGNLVRSFIKPTSASALVRERPIQQAHLVLGTLGYDVNNDLRNAMVVMNTILGGGMSSRLNLNIREKYGFCYTIYSFANMFSDTGDFGVYMGTDPGKVERSRSLIFRELDKIVKQVLSPRMLTQAKLQLKGGLMLGLESMSNRTMRLGRGEIYHRRYFTLDEVIERIDAVTTDEIQTVATEVFDPSRFTSVVLVPSS